MMAFGSYSGGGVGVSGEGSSSSSSNLSALAPPFVVDKSFPKPNTNASLHFTEGSYTARSDPSFPIWLHHRSPSYSSEPNQLDSEPVGTICEPSSDVYRGSGSEFRTSTNARYALSNSSGAGGCARTSDSLPYYKCSNSSTLPSTHAEPKPYYPSFVSSLGYDDSHQLVHQDPSYDLPSNSVAALLGGSSQVGFPNFSGIEYPSAWNHDFSVSADGEQRKWTELCGSFVKPEDHAAEGFRSFRDATTVSDKCYDNFGRGYHFTFPGDVGKPFIQSNTRANDIECSQEPTPNSIFLQSPHHQEPALESTRNTCNFQNPRNISSGNPISVIGSSISGSTLATKAPPVTVIKPPCGGSGKSVKSAKNAIDVCDDFAEYDPFNLKERHYSFGVKCQPTSSVGSTWDFFAGSAFNYGAEALIRQTDDNKSFCQLPKSEAMPLTLNLSSPDGVKSRSDASETISCQKCSDGLDQNSHAVDSPCWKGAPAARISPFDASEAMASKPLLECDDLMNQRPQCIPQNITEGIHSASEKVNDSTYMEEKPSVVSCLSMEDNSCSVRGSCQIKCNDVDGKEDIDAIHLASKEVKENTFLKHTSVIGNMFREFGDSDSVQGLCHSKQKGNHGFQNIDKSAGTDFSFGSNPKTDLYSKIRVQQTEKVSPFAYTTKPGGPVLLASVANEKNGKDTGTTTVDAFSAVPPSATDHLQTSPGLEDTTNCSQPSEIVSNSKLDVNIVVNTMKNLSELLRYHCSNNPASICQQDQAALKHVINNLDACIEKEAVKNPLTEEVLVPQRGVLPLHGSPAQKVTGLGSEQEREKGPTHMGNWKIADVMWPGSDIFRRTNNQGSGSLKENLEMDYSLIYAIKSVLYESFSSKEEKDPQTILYKHLWLEAEASLCAITTRARLLSMKTDMENYVPHKEEEIADVKYFPGSKVSREARNVADPVLMAEASLTPVALIHDSLSSADDVKSSVMSRYHFLNSRLSQSNSLGIEVQQSPNKGKSVPSLDCQSPEICASGIKGSTGTSIDSKTAASIMGRHHILNPQGDKSSVKFQEQQSPRTENSRSSLHCQSMNNCGIAANGSSLTTGGKDIEACVMSRFQILKSRDEDLHLANTEVTEFPQKNMDESLEDTPAADQQVQDFCIQNTTADTDNSEASVLARFHILQNRIGSSNSVKVGLPQLPVQAAEPMLNPGSNLEDGFCGQDLIQQTNCGITGGNFGNYPNWPENKIGCMPTLDVGNSRIGNWLNNQVVEGWYACSASDWEHVSRSDLRQK